MLQVTKAVALIGSLCLVFESPAADTKKDEDLIQGTWVMVAVERDGEKEDLSVEKDEKKQITVIFSGNKTFMKIGDLEIKEYLATFKLDSSKKPKQMDTVVKKENVEKITKTIYETGRRYAADLRPRTG